MPVKSYPDRPCLVCRKSFPHSQLVAAATVRASIAELIRSDHPDWSVTAVICGADLNVYRSRYVHELLSSEKGELSSLEREVLDSMRDHELLARNPEHEDAALRTLGERMADRLASFGGSWTFLIAFAGFLFLWILMNSLVLLWRPVDPYPYILLNLMLSCLAAIQAPVIMMSQNRQDAKDRIRSEHDYQVNLKAELEIRHLHEKMDHLLSHQWERLTQIQEIQLELLSELGRKP